MYLQSGHPHILSRTTKDFIGVTNKKTSIQPCKHQQWVTKLNQTYPNHHCILCKNQDKVKIETIKRRITSENKKPMNHNTHMERFCFYCKKIKLINFGLLKYNAIILASGVMIEKIDVYTKWRCLQSNMNGYNTKKKNPLFSNVFFQ